MSPTFFDSIPAYLAACAIVVLSQIVYVLFGFGSGLVLVGLLALVVPDLRDVVVLVLLVNVPAELVVVFRSRRWIRWQGVASIGIGVAAGIPLGTVILRFGDPTILLAVLGLSLIVIGAVFLRLDDGFRIDPPWWTAPPTGLLSGVLTGMFGTGGPPLIVYYRLSGLAKAEFRGNLMAIFLLMTCVRLPSYLAGGLITRPRLAAGVAVLPAVAVGAWIGHRIHLDIPDATFRRWIALGLFAIGILLLVRVA